MYIRFVLKLTSTIFMTRLDELAQSSSILIEISAKGHSLWWRMAILTGNASEKAVHVFSAHQVYFWRQRCLPYALLSPRNQKSQNPSPVHFGHWPLGLAVKKLSSLMLSRCTPGCHYNLSLHCPGVYKCNSSETYAIFAPLQYRYGSRDFIAVSTVSLKGNT